MLDFQGLHLLDNLNFSRPALNVTDRFMTLSACLALCAAVPSSHVAAVLHTTCVCGGSMFVVQIRVPVEEVVVVVVSLSFLIQKSVTVYDILLPLRVYRQHTIQMAKIQNPARQNFKIFGQ